jgi:hypothetical protein
VLAQRVVHLVGEPALVPELEAVAPRRQCREHVGEPAVVAPEVRRQLPEERAELRRVEQGLEPLEDDGVMKRLILTANRKPSGLSSTQRRTASTFGSR